MKDHSSHPLVGLIAAVFLLLAGIYCLLNPHKLQKDLVDYYSRNPKVEQADPFSSYVRSPAYIAWMRFSGVAFILVALLLFSVACFGYDPLPTW